MGWQKRAGMHQIWHGGVWAFFLVILAAFWMAGAASANLRIFAAAYMSPVESKALKKRMHEVLAQDAYATPKVTAQNIHVTLLGGDGSLQTYSAPQTMALLSNFAKNLPSDCRLCFSPEGSVRNGNALKYPHEYEPKKWRFIADGTLPPEKSLVAALRAPQNLQNQLGLGQRVFHATLLQNPDGGAPWSITHDFTDFLAQELGTPLKTHSVVIHVTGVAAGTEDLYQLELKMRPVGVECILWKGRWNAQKRFAIEGPIQRMQVSRDWFQNRLGEMGESFSLPKASFFLDLAHSLMQGHQELSLNPKRSAGRLNLGGWDNPEYRKIIGKSRSAFCTPSPDPQVSIGGSGLVEDNQVLEATDAGALMRAASFENPVVQQNDAASNDDASDAEWGMFSEELGSPMSPLAGTDSNPWGLEDSADMLVDMPPVAVASKKRGWLQRILVDAPAGGASGALDVETDARPAKRPISFENRLGGIIKMALMGAQLGNHIRHSTQQAENPGPVLWGAALSALFGALLEVESKDIDTGELTEFLRASPALVPAAG